MVTQLSETALLRWIPLLPLMAAVVHGVMLAVVRRPMPRFGVIAVSLASVLASFLLTCAAFWELIGLGQVDGLHDVLYTWMGVGAGSGSFAADLAFQFDSLSAVMCLVVTGVGFLIHVYSVGYMDEDHRDDRGFQRFFCYLNLFLAAMLMLMLGDNLLVLFLGWEGVGLCSYLLIGFWYSDEWNAYCGTKAFIVNRIGDFGFLVGILLLFWSLADVGAGTVTFREIEAAFPRIAEQTLALPDWLGGGEMLLPTLIGICLFVGACGKSAQLPLYTWLPDAMAGPTPVSALIHAATMVTAGVYMVCRMSFLFAAAPGASALIAWVGGATAIFAATIAVAQTDIKKVLAYSTVSQLGYMFLAAGCGAYAAAMFHVVTHAFFKALLFLGAGAVIVAMHHEQDMMKMGKLRKKLPLTHVVMAVGVLAIGGLPFFSGFFSKDEILLSAWAAHDVPGHLALYWLGAATAVLTAFYMGRLYFLTFWGDSRVEQKVRAQLDDPSSWIMYPLYVLAVLSAVGGLMGLPQFWGDVIDVEESDSLGNFLHRTIQAAPAHDIASSTEWGLIGIAVGAFAVGTGLAYLLYQRHPDWPGRLAESLGFVYRFVRDKYYVDELYDRVIVRPLVAISDEVLYRVFDAGVIDGIAVNGTARSVRALAAQGLKYAQSGLVQGYMLIMVAGALLVVAYLIGWDS
ncbi:MAG: NADH-quinone oxidoreductase subunit L [Myxococcota bacterium]